MENNKAFTLKWPYLFRPAPRRDIRPRETRTDVLRNTSSADEPEREQTCIMGNESLQSITKNVQLFGNKVFGK